VRKPRLIAVDTPFTRRLVDGLGYPLHGAALTTIVAVGLGQVLGAFVPVMGWLVLTVSWAAMYVYAFECLRHTADGYAEPPEMAMDTSLGVAFTLILIQVLGGALAILVPVFVGPAGLLLSLLLALALPAITMSLAFGGSVNEALNPRTWFEAMSRFGRPYFVLAAICFAVWMLQFGVRYALQGFLPQVLAIPLFYLFANYATLLNFHLMGGLIHQYHERVGHVPESEAMVAEAGMDDDDELLAHTRDLAADDLPTAIGLLTQRLRDGAAPVALHAQYRDWLRRANRRDELLVHGQIWIAALVATGESRRALGVAQDCMEIDPGFLPDDPLNAGPLADIAAHAGMPRLALHLARGYARRWPKDFGSAHYGLLAVRMLDRLGQRAEAIVLLTNLRRAWPDHPLQIEMAALDAAFDTAPALAGGRQ
jgi:hypothetical protein